MLSISHSQSHAAVIVSKDPTVQALGIDLESKNRTINPKIKTKIAFEDEYQELTKYFSSNEALLRIFSAKEAIYKYMYNLDRSLLGFHDVKLSWLEEQGVFNVAAMTERAGAIGAVFVYVFEVFGVVLSVLEDRGI